MLLNKVQKTRSPYDGDWVYWGKRLRKIPDKPLRVIKLLKLQQSKCDNVDYGLKVMI
ncbi:hypothetical protein [Wolbachia endosymbiont of Nasonia giraulti]|uniref:hypothetical protein n=1 Tax=Wolbachia endosymbiont of Nasonia giraulti TaxID=180838 RepID=UPI003A89B731